MTETTDFKSLVTSGSPEELTAIAEKIGRPSELKGLLELSGGDDGLIEQFVSKAGTDTMLDRVFSLMGTYFLAERVGSDSGVVQWNINTPDGQRVYQLAIADGRAEGARGEAEQPRTTLSMSTPDLMRLCSGVLDGISAFMNGKIKLAGDMMFGAKLPAAFDTAA